MDLIIDLIDQLIELKIKQRLGGDDWNDYARQIAVVKERLRRVLAENVLTG